MNTRNIVVMVLVFLGITRALASEGLPALTSPAVAQQAPPLAQQQPPVASLAPSTIQQPLSVAQAPSVAQQQSAADPRIQRIEDQLNEVRRDQLNYRIEKDLLEKAYSSNLQVINGALTLFLAVVSIIGFLGIRDINTLKDKFSKELSHFANSRTSFESQVATAKGSLEAALKEFRETKATIEAEVKKQVAVNTAQNNRIQVLELQEKVADLIRGGANQRALEYISAGLNLDPQNGILLRFRGTALWRSGDLAGAMGAFRKALELDPNDINSVMNSIELALIIPDFATYSDFKTKYITHVAGKDDGELKDYFDVLELYQRGESAKLYTAIKDWLGKHQAKRKYCGTWSFSEVIHLLEKRPASKEREAIRLFIDTLNDAIAPGDALSAINALFA